MHYSQNQDIKNITKVAFTRASRLKNVRVRQKNGKNFSNFAVTGDSSEQGVVNVKSPRQREIGCTAEVL